MLYVIIAFIAGVLLPLIPLLIWKRNATAKFDREITLAKNAEWKIGFSSGWDSASTDYWHVKHCYDELRKSRS